MWKPKHNLASSSPFFFSSHCRQFHFVSCSLHFGNFFFLAASCSFIKIVFAPSLRFLFIALVQEIRKRDSFYGRFFLALVFSFVFCAFDDVVFWQSFTNCGVFFFSVEILHAGSIIIIVDVVRRFRLSFFSLFFSFSLLYSFVVCCCRGT